MTDHSILYSAPMVLACLAGRKTQTRRILNPQPVENEGMNCRRLTFFHKNGAIAGNASYDLLPDGECPASIFMRYQIGDRLYAREAWRTFVSLDNVKPRDLWSPGCGKGAGILYEADQFGLALTSDGERWEGERGNPEAFGKLRPGMFMLRWASRFTQIVTDVRVQRLHDITPEDAIAEGIEKEPYAGGDPQFQGMFSWKDYSDHPFAAAGFREERPVLSYQSLWESINGEGSWAANPWVVAYTFTTERKNIDA